MGKTFTRRNKKGKKGSRKNNRPGNDYESEYNEYKKIHRKKTRKDSDTESEYN